MINGIHIDDIDSCVTISAAAAPGDVVTYVEGGVSKQVTAIDNVPIYHKIAIKPVAKGENVMKYGQVIGVASCDIVPGNHVHTHNIEEPEREV